MTSRFGEREGTIQVEQLEETRCVEEGKRGDRRAWMASGIRRQVREGQLEETCLCVLRMELVGKDGRGLGCRNATLGGVKRRRTGS